MHTVECSVETYKTPSAEMMLEKKKKTRKPEKKDGDKNKMQRFETRPNAS